MKKILLLLFTSLIGFSALSQNYKGIWHGHLTGDGLLNKSFYSLNVKSQEGNIITGRAYIYNNYFFVFYGIFDFIGTIEEGNLKITELALGEYEIPRHNLCTKFANVNYSKQGNTEYLKGTWKTLKGFCPVEDVVLRKYVSEEGYTDFPVELMNKIKEDKSNGILFKGTTLTKPFVLDITKPTIKIELRDYLKEDNDTVTVYANREEVITKRRITNRAYKKTISFTKLHGLNEIIVYANNLGQVPPNTCVMIIDDGHSKQRVNILSSKQSSAVIYLNYKPLAAVPHSPDIKREQQRAHTKRVKKAGQPTASL